MRCLLVFLIACGGSTTPVPAKPTAVASAAELAPLPYTTDQLRAGCPAGRVIPLRLEMTGKPTSVLVFTFVTSDAEGADIETSIRDEAGQIVRSPKREHSTW